MEDCRERKDKTCHHLPIFPAPTELEVTQMMGKPINKPIERSGQQWGDRKDEWLQSVAETYIMIQTKTLFYRVRSTYSTKAVNSPATYLFLCKSYHSSSPKNKSRISVFLKVLSFFSNRYTLNACFVYTHTAEF